MAVLLSACSGHAGPTAGSALVATGPTTSTAPITSPTVTTTPPPATAAAPSTTVKTAAPKVTAPKTTVSRPKPTTPPTTRVTQPACPANLAAQLASTQGAAQLVTVDAPSPNATSATVTLWQRPAECWVPVGGPWPARVGVHGVSSQHREGDGTTPAGGYRISSAFYGLASDPGVHGSYHQLVCGDWWDEDPASPQYNSFQQVACGATPPFGGRSEALWQATTAYQRFAVVQYNTGPVVAGDGSGVFIHDDVGGPTNGCVSLPPAQLDTLLRWLQPAQALVVIGADAEIRRF